MEPMQEVSSGIYDLAQFWLHTDSSSQNQNASELDSACLLGTDFCECYSIEYCVSTSGDVEEMGMGVGGGCKTVMVTRGFQ